VAAHLKTGVNLLINALEQNKHLHPGHAQALIDIDIDCFTSDSLSVWLAIDNYTNNQDGAALLTTLCNLIPDIEMLWENLGRPDTREQWLERLYG